VDVIHLLVGTYRHSLDPNRCLDLTVDALEGELSSQDILQAQSECHTGAFEDCSVPVDEHDSTTASFTKCTNRMTRRLQFLWHCIDALSATTKLPQLLGFKLLAGKASNRIPSLLRCLTWLCSYQRGTTGIIDNTLLDPVQMLPYLPDEADFSALID
jgi:hypothetical protein